MSKSDAFETALLNLMFNNSNIANIGDATGVRGSTTAGQLFLSLHTSDPGEAGTQSTNEITTGAYQNYVRVGVNRASGAGGFTITGNSVSPASNVDFATAGAGSTGATVTHFGIGASSSGTGTLLYKGTVSPNIVIANGVAARLTTASAITED
jgi:hypothetical protein